MTQNTTLLYVNDLLQALTSSSSFLSDTTTRLLNRLEAHDPAVFNRLLCLHFGVWVYQVRDLPDSEESGDNPDHFVVTTPAEAPFADCSSIPACATEDEAWELGVNQLELKRLYRKACDQYHLSGAANAVEDAAGATDSAPVGWRFSYFVHYSWTGSSDGLEQSGKGMINIRRARAIRTFSDLEELVEFIKGYKGFDSVIVSNYQELAA